MSADTEDIKVHTNTIRGFVGPVRWESGSGFYCYSTYVDAPYRACSVYSDTVSEFVNYLRATGNNAAADYAERTASNNFDGAFLGSREMQPSPQTVEDHPLWIPLQNHIQMSSLGRKGSPWSPEETYLRSGDSDVRRLLAQRAALAVMSDRTSLVAAAFNLVSAEFGDALSASDRLAAALEIYRSASIVTDKMSIDALKSAAATVPAWILAGLQPFGEFTSSLATHPSIPTRKYALELFKDLSLMPAIDALKQSADLRREVASIICEYADDIQSGIPEEQRFASASKALVYLFDEYQINLEGE